VPCVELLIATSKPPNEVNGDFSFVRPYAPLRGEPRNVNRVQGRTPRVYHFSPPYSLPRQREYGIGDRRERNCPILHNFGVIAFCACEWVRSARVIAMLHRDCSGLVRKCPSNLSLNRFILAQFEKNISPSDRILYPIRSPFPAIDGIQVLAHAR
jgi:hypothetical protein